MDEHPKPALLTIEKAAARFDGLVFTLSSEWATHELRSVCDRIEFNPDIRTAIADAKGDKERMKQVLFLVMDDISDPVQSFLHYLVEHDSMELLEQKEALLGEVTRLLEGKLEVVLTAAVPLEAPVRKRIESQVSERLSKPVRLLVQQDEALGAGCVLDIEGERHDFSLRGGLYPHIRTYLMNHGRIL